MKGSNVTVAHLCKIHIYIMHTYIHTYLHTYILTYVQLKRFAFDSVSGQSYKLGHYVEYPSFVDFGPYLVGKQVRFADAGIFLQYVWFLILMKTLSMYVCI